MRQHNPIGGRKCWSSAREKERLRARFLIRDRVASGVDSSTKNGTQNTGDDASDAGVPSCENIEINDTLHSDQIDIILKYVRYIRSGDKSKFSLTSMANHVNELVLRIPTSIMQDDMPHTLQLCIAWFGKDYSNFLQHYMESLTSITLMEYAIWMGKYSILGNLLIGGINPCIRSQHNTIQLITSEHPISLEDGDWQNRQRYMGTLVLKRFFDSFPIQLSSYIVKRVVDMRMNAYYQYWRSQHTCRIEQEQQRSCILSTNPFEKSCRLCEKAVPLNFALEFAPCSHIFCEPCFWEDLLCNIDMRDESDDVVLCPICGTTCRNLPLPIQRNDVNNKTSNGSKHQCDGSQGALEVKPPSPSSTPTSRRLESLTKFSALPVDREELKRRREKRKKLSEQQHLSSSWICAVRLSLGSTQDVRRDKFFAYVDKNAIHYVRASLILGVNINWTNEYGQTALYISVWRGNLDIVGLLLEYGADASIAANGGSTIRDLILHHEKGNELSSLFNLAGIDISRNPGETTLTRCAPLNIPTTVESKTLIEVTECHPGAGSYIIDDTLSSSALAWLLELRKRLPVEKSSNKEAVLCSTRSYYCDSEGFLCELLTNTIKCSGIVQSPTSHSVITFPHMRFLHYDKEGIELAPHVDLCRVDSTTGERSTHSFLLYLTDCEDGGETSLLGALSGDARYQVLAAVAPKCGRLLLFPHACPHEGNRVVDVPKTLLRGEVMISNPGPDLDEDSAR